MSKGQRSGLTRARIVDAGWFDESLTLRELGLALGCDAVTVMRNARKLGLPPRKRQWAQIKAHRCEWCSCLEHCNQLQATAARFPCQPVDAWDADEMEWPTNGNVQHSNFEAEGVIRYSNKRAKGN